VIVDRRLFNREKLAGYYSEFSYLSSKLLVDVIPVRIASGLLLAAIAYWISALRREYFVFMRFLVATSLVQTTSVAVSFCLSAGFKNFGEANLVGAVFFIFCIIFGGYFVNGNSDSASFKYVSFLFYGYEALMVNEFDGLSLSITAAGYTVNGIKGSVILGELGLNRNNFGQDIGILFVWLCGFLLCTLLLLKYRRFH
jgi:ATP-binding cassette subfamily G (WHITE) protein 2